MAIRKYKVLNFNDFSKKPKVLISKQVFISPMKKTFNNLTEVKEYLESVNIPIEYFSGHTIHSAIGNIGMAFGVIHITGDNKSSRFNSNDFIEFLNHKAG